MLILQLSLFSLFIHHSLYSRLPRASMRTDQSSFCNCGTKGARATAPSTMASLPLHHQASRSPLVTPTPPHMDTLNTRNPMRSRLKKSSKLWRFEHDIIINIWNRSSDNLIICIIMFCRTTRTQPSTPLRLALTVWKSTEPMDILLIPFCNLRRTNALMHMVEVLRTVSALLARWSTLLLL